MLVCRRLVLQFDVDPQDVTRLVRLLTVEVFLALYNEFVDRCSMLV